VKASTASTARLVACLEGPACATIAGMSITTRLCALQERDDGFDDEPTVPSYLTRLASTPDGARVLANWMEAVEREEDGSVGNTS
jgi:hypothetical protein